jgi:hypothetical protein
VKFGLFNHGPDEAVKDVISRWAASRLHARAVYKKPDRLQSIAFEDITNERKAGKERQ